MLQVRAVDAEPTFSHELHEAAYEGGQQWIERLVEEEGVLPDTKDQVCPPHYPGRGFCHA